MSEKSDHDSANRESQPSAAGPEGLAGDMGLSSEREGPFEGIEATGSLASAANSTDGESPTTRAPHPEVESAEDTDKPDDSATVSDVDRTVGEVQPDPVANKHEFDPSKNPRH